VLLDYTISLVLSFWLQSSKIVISDVKNFNNSTEFFDTDEGVNETSKRNNIRLFYISYGQMSNLWYLLGGSLYKEEKLKPVLVFIIFAVILRKTVCITYGLAE